MKYSRILSVLFFLASLAVFVGFTVFYNKKDDTSAPVLQMSAEVYECSIHDPEESLLAGITAKDNKDGDVTDKIFVESLSNFIEDNTRELRFAVLDKAGNCAKGKRMIRYTDYSSPKFSMSKPLVFYMGEDRITEYIHVEDILDGNLSGKVSVSSGKHLNYKPGDYPMEFMVSNSVGDIVRFHATVTLKNYLETESRAEIALTEYLVYTPAGVGIDPWSLVRGLSINGHDYVMRDGQLVPNEESNYYWNDYPPVITAADFRISNTVDYATPGCYEITYSYNFQEYAAEVRLVVIVE